MKKVVWGVLSTARIGVKKVIPSLMKSDLIEVRGIASRSLSAAEDAAAELGLAKAYGSYEALLDDPEIEVIYNPLPNHLHVPLTLEAAKRGKHVLCEKPFALSTSELDTLTEAAQSVHIAEAFMVRFQSAWIEARERVRRGDIGELRMVQSFFTYLNDNPADIRNDPSIGGGGLMDIGCYPIVAARFFFEADPVRAIGLFDRDARFKTDTLTSGLLDFGFGRQASFGVSTLLCPAQSLILFGTRGRIEIPVPYNAFLDRPNQIFTDDGQSLDRSTRVIDTVETDDQYTRMGEAFSRSVRGEIPLPYGLDDARTNMRIIDALFRSEHSQHWEAIG